MSDQTERAVSGEVAQQLQQWCGVPVRVTILDRESRERLERISGAVQAVGRGLTVECTRPALYAREGAPATIEILVNGDHIFFRTTVLSGAAGSRDRLMLALPAHMETLQRRRHPRVDLKVPVCVVSNSHGGTIQARLRDLSAGGASVLTTQPVSAGERAVLVFPIATGMYFQDLEGQILRCTDGPGGEYVLAMQFHCTPQMEQAIAAWVERRLADDDNAVLQRAAGESLPGW